MRSADTRCEQGPIVRINPHELSIDDPDFLLDEVFAFKSKLDRYEGATKHFAMSDATVFTVSHDLHKLRRGPLASFFSRSMVSQSEDLIRNKVGKLCSRITGFQGTEQPIDLSLAFRCLTTDVVTQHVLSKSYGLLSTPDFSPAWFEAVRESGEFAVVGKHFPWLVSCRCQATCGRLVQRLEPQDLSGMNHSRDLSHDSSHTRSQNRHANPDIVQVPLMKDLPRWLIRRLNPKMVRYMAKSEV